MGNGDGDVGTTEFERQKVSAVCDYPPGCGPFAPHNFLEPAVDASNIDAIQNEEDAAKTVYMFMGSSEIGTEPQPLKASNVSPCTAIVPQIML